MRLWVARYSVRPVLVGIVLDVHISELILQKILLLFIQLCTRISIGLAMTSNIYKMLSHKGVYSSAMQFLWNIPQGFFLYSCLYFLSQLSNMMVVVVAEGVAAFDDILLEWKQMPS